MAVLSQLQGIFRRPVPAEVTGTPAVEPVTDEEKKTPTAAVVNDGDEKTDRPAEGLQHGVEQVEAVTLSWSKASLIFVFAKYVSLTA